MDVLQPALRKVVIDPVAVILMRFRDRREILQDLIDIWEPHPNLIQITESASGADPDCNQCKPSNE